MQQNPCSLCATSLSSRLFLRPAHVSVDPRTFPSGCSSRCKSPRVKCCSGGRDGEGNEGEEPRRPDLNQSRRDFMLNSVNLAILGAAISADGTTIVNSILGETKLSPLPVSYVPLGAWSQGGWMLIMSWPYLRLRGQTKH